ncbi:CYFA0S06e00210g1_1 [Cyberlindnera fabianii]|uniref:CYFA0S06e00210g1_1 n=1 Tax=Cyberlindnera fabianii TaxID=36022 RepID=A0A061B204_CYBFA|nr:Protein kinase MCK1 [Cyberlindnera fabianii]CDR41011.1 CYFA0S06e00210g1_1 [Cyberlindnera fabianii]
MSTSKLLNEIPGNSQATREGVLTSTSIGSEFLANDVTHNRSGVVRQMLVKQYKKIGEGAFGIVSQAKLLDGETWIGPYAIKKVPAQTEYKSRELEILRLTNHPNIISLEYFFTHKSPEDGKVYLHLAMECLPETLQLEIRRYYVSKLELPVKHVQLYTYQLARAMLYLHALGICHRDIKPSNILVDPATGVLKVCDFGSAKRLEPKQVSVAYICSRYYRAPELIVGSQYYSTSIDIWGLGCVLAEMLIGKAIFQGEDPILQLREISKLLGPPDKRFIFNSNPKYNGPLFSKPLFNGKASSRFQKVLGNAGDKCVDLLMKVLVYEPEKRLSPRRILAHEFFDDLRHDGQFVPRGSPGPAPLPKLFNFSSFELDVIGDLRDKVVV